VVGGFQPVLPLFSLLGKSINSLYQAGKKENLFHRHYNSKESEKLPWLFGMGLLAFM
jgi:hypothetical protein